MESRTTENGSDDRTGHATGIRREALTLPGAGVRLTGDRWVPAAGDASGTVVLLHGGGQTRHAWRRAAERLAAAGWAAVAVDLRGHGDSDWAPAGDYAVEDYAADLRALITALGGRPVVVGASLGGIAALTALGRCPGLAAGLVLVDVVPRTAPEGRGRIAAFLSGGGAGFASLEEAADTVAALAPDRPRPRSPEGLRRNLRLRADGRWYWHWDPRFLTCREEADRDREEARLVAAARALTIPTMLVRGARSEVVTDAAVAELRELVPHLRVEVVEAGHMVTGDDNGVFTEHLVDFLTRIAQDPAGPRRGADGPATPGR
ncbi:alpha/beta hydrolase [Pseudonocardia sp. C8]|uniref:alpha/beta fold hydrolase n=1 Tax=Pseudonocardia sp. C8 TaxID=2762759 RepID=UPI001642EB8B|nr:alpha/beta hydrolase [Pseudonocardia sp. C8]MBC3191725.1 alpha/beta hydrolase [Pseudonocardia sp. C8]